MICGRRQRQVLRPTAMSRRWQGAVAEPEIQNFAHGCSCAEPEREQGGATFVEVPQAQGRSHPALVGRMNGTVPHGTVIRSRLSRLTGLNDSPWLRHGFMLRRTRRC